MKHARLLFAAGSFVALLVTAVACSSGTPKSVPTDTPRIATAFTDNCPASDGTSVALPDLTLPCLGGGRAVSLAGLSQLPVIVNIWGSWCGPCQREAPLLQSVYASAQGSVHVLGIDMEDTDGSALDFAKHVGMRYPSVVDRSGDVLRKLGLRGAPVTVFIDGTGAVVYKQVGEFKSAADLNEKIQQYLKVSP
ncbi:MAG: hypothetical protein QOG53_1434 [Frankiales bacterium]|nr:hypothetical protein [Frankiales bacterium]